MGSVFMGALKVIFSFSLGDAGVGVHAPEKAGTTDGSKFLVKSGETDGDNLGARDGVPRDPL
jgi:hypothetical protein